MNELATIATKLNRIERHISAGRGKSADWIEAPVFAKRTGKTVNQIRYFRIKYPEMVKVKPRSNRYLFDYVAYSKMFLQ